MKRIICLIVCGALLLSGAVVSVFAASNESIIYDYITSKLGLSSAAACGVLANIEKESGFEPNIYGDSGTSYGICQWHDYAEGEGRFTRMKDYCEANGLDYTDITAQLAFLGYELQNFYPKVWNALVTAENTPDGAYEVAYYWCYNFEIPANRGVAAELRGASARDKYWPVYGKEGPGPIVPDTAEKWRVTSDVGLNVRTGPGTEYPVSAKYTCGSEIYVTEKTKSGIYTWGKTPVGWCVLDYCEFVSGPAARTLSYFTDCAVNIPSQSLDVNDTVASANSLTKNGFYFLGWSDVRDGEIKYLSGDRYTGEGGTLYGVWRRNPKKPLVPGDVNCDGSVTAKDVSVLVRHMSGWETCMVAEASDANEDGTVNAKDVAYLMKYLAGWIDGEERPDDEYPDVILTEEEKSFLRRTLFVGDSICCGYNVTGIVPDESIIAKSGASTYNIFSFTFKMGGEDGLSLTEAAKKVTYIPEYIVITLGMNDLNVGSSKRYTEDYQKVVDALLEVFPDTPVAVCATTPITASSTFATGTKISEYNKALSEFAAKNGYTYVNTNVVLRGTDGFLKPLYWGNDDVGVHLSAKAYPVLAKRICDTIIK